ncbi:hypothetical protein TRFO_33382 [Tritrichomonas foetus]|uniref:ubiquitinyl hydrolase 1 n=1 Tax=Tritrichomonas foetus TaxID=1144522 RepID=A0A1J4JMW6_9EUKA|nr:hypothetical protein TRFO_33382 [Tritrichomonas foetus]|eukprot:OHT00034.1 hypothetical protein TRFO_33382 [Tritrichomonas foetus]
MVKINSRFEFPPTIDLSPYLAPNADRSKSSIFDLYGVLVHSGSVNFGHYYAFLRTSTSEQWYQFNDSNVSRATYEQAVTNNFGGSNSCMSNYNHNGGSYDIGYGMSYEKSFSAYMLIYIRRDDAPRLMKPVQKEDIPPHLLDCLKEDDNHTYGYYKQTKSEVTIKVIHEDSILVNSIKNTTGYKCGPLVKNFKFNSKTTNAELYEKVADEFKLDKNEIRLYLTYSKFSPYRIIQCDDASIDTYYTSLFLQKKPKEEQLEITDHILLLKFFHISLEVPIQYIGYLSVKPSSTVSDISPKISQILGFPEDTEYEIFTMGYQDELKPLGNDSTLENYSYSIYQIFIQLKKNSPINISSATFKWHTKQEIIQKYGESIFDKKSTKKTQTKKDGNEKKDEVNNSKLKKIIYKDTTNKSITSITKYMKRFKQLTKAILYLLDEPNTPIYEIEFPAAAITAIQLQNFLVKNLNLDFNEEKDTLLISKCLNNNSTSQPVVIMAQPNETVERDFHTYMKSKFNIYVHLVKNVTKDELENMISITLFISTDGFNVSLKKTIFLPKKSFIKDLRTKVEEMIDEKIIKYDMVDNKTPEIRISSVNQNQISSICEMDEKISFLNHTFRFDLVPNCQLDLSNNEYLTTGTFMKNNEYHHCSAIKDPFYFVVNKTEKVSELKNRLKEILHLENSLSRCKVYFKSTSTYNIKDNILLKDNDEIVGDLIGNKELELIILYPPEKSKISRDESLKIYN